MYKLAAIVPTYNHYKDLRHVVEQIVNKGIDVLIVDDASASETTEEIFSIFKNLKNVNVLFLPCNIGKGGAVFKGFEHLKKQGYTHAFQIDADGQHDLSCIDSFVHISKANPSALVSGNPRYNDCVPTARKIGRWFTHIWVYIETLSFRILDSMCGFRIYPIDVSLSLKDIVDFRMDFDTDIIVRLFWKGVPTIMVPVNVFYPAHNTSNFDVIKDNWRITKMHTKLVFHMIFNIVTILKNRPNYKTLNTNFESLSWASLEERGTYVGIYVLSFILKCLGKKVCSVLARPIVFYYYLMGSEQRKSSYQYLKKVLNRSPTFSDQMKHYLNFFDMTIDKLSAWLGHEKIDTVDNFKSLENVMNNKKSGALLLISHLGNMDFCRAIAHQEHRTKLHVLLHTKNSKQFNHMLRFFNPKVEFNIIEVTEIGPETIIYLKDKVEEGDFVVIAADRFPVTGDKRVSRVPFLGELALFSQGPYILASFLECPVYTAIAVKEDEKYKIFLDLFSEKIILYKDRRDQQLKEYCTKYAQYLESMVKKFPYQWFNFYNFWK